MSRSCDVLVVVVVVVVVGFDVDVDVDMCPSFGCCDRENLLVVVTRGEGTFICEGPFDFLRDSWNWKVSEYNGKGTWLFRDSRCAGRARSNVHLQ